MFFILWFVATAGIIGILMSRHGVPFKIPAGLAAFSKQAVSGLFEAAGAQFVAVHVLDIRCGCSRAVLESLGQFVKRSEKLGVKHVVVLLNHKGDAAEQVEEATLEPLRKALVSIQSLTLAQAKSVFQIESVPWLVVLSKELGGSERGIFNINYMGGYSDRSIASVSDVQWPSIIEKIVAHDDVKALPSFGCVTSEQIRQQLLYNL